jgi:serine protease Do
VVGVNTAVFSTGQGLSFAIPINIAKDAADQLIKNGKVERGWLGVSTKYLSDDLAKRLGTKAGAGAFIFDTVKGSPADQAGILPSDIITEVNGEKIESNSSLPRLIASFKPGSKVEVTLFRNGRDLKKRVVLGDLDNPHKSYVFPLSDNETTQKLPDGSIGIDVKELDADQKSAGMEGLEITKVHEYSIASSLGLQRGDIILSVNNKKLDNLKDFEKSLKKSDRGDIVSLLIKRGQKLASFAFRKE